TEDDVANVARKLGASAIVAGLVQRAGKNWDLTVTVRDGANGNVMGRASFALKKGGQIDHKIAGKIAGELLPLLARAGESGGEVPPPPVAAEKPPAPEAAVGGGEAAAPAVDEENPIDRAPKVAKRSHEAGAAPLPANEPTAGALDRSAKSAARS